MTVFASVCCVLKCRNTRPFRIFVSETFVDYENKIAI